MSGWDDFKDSAGSDGSGRLGVRMVIPGMPYEAVTDSSMCTVGTYDGYRASGLILETVLVEEHVDMARATSDVSPMTIELVDDPSSTDGVPTPWTKLFSKTPSNTTWLAATCTDLDTTITVRSTDGFASSGTLYIDQEEITYSGKTSTTFTGCTRGANLTLPTYHYSLDTTGTDAAEITDWPRTMKGRHVFFYAYTATDSPTGNGKQFWIGKISSDAKLGADKCTWTLEVDPLTRVFEEPLGGDLGTELPLRGIYYPWNCLFALRVWVSSDSTAANLPVAPSAIIQVDGFFETQDEFVRTVNAKIAAAGAPTSTCGLSCVSDGPSGYHFELQTPTASQKFVAIFAGSPVDNLHTNRFFPGFPVIPLLKLGIIDTGTTTSVATSTLYTFPQNTPPPGIALATGEDTTGRAGGAGNLHTNAVTTYGAVPRGAFCMLDAALPLHDDYYTLFTSTALQATRPANRLYLGGFSSLLAISSVVLTVGDSDGGKITMSVLGTPSDSSRYVDLDNGTPDVQSVCFAGGDLPTVLNARLYCQSGNLKVLRAGLLGAVPSGAPIGNAPYIYDSSLSGSTLLSSDFAPWDAADVTAGRASASRTIVATKKQKLGDVLRPEAQNTGCFWALDTSGRIELRQVGVAPTGVTWMIDATEELSDQGGTGYERNSDGSVAQIFVSTGYDPIEDDWKGRTYEFNSPTARGRDPDAQPVEIKPRSMLGLSSMPSSALFDEYNVVAAGLFAMYGYPYEIIPIDVPFTFFNAVCGDNAIITSKNLPDGAGGRGMSLRGGVIVGRRWPMGSPGGTLYVHCVDINYAGYTPTSRISSYVDQGGNLYTLTIATPAAGPTRAYSDATVWVDNDVIRVVVWDSNTSTTRSGIVKGHTSTTVDVQLTGAIPGGTLNLEYDLASAGWTANQKQYCAIAATTDRIDYGGGTTVPARQFAG